MAFTGTFATLRSAQRCPLGGKGYYEIEILERDDNAPQSGVAGPGLARVRWATADGVVDDAHSWAVDGARQFKWHDGAEAWECK